MATRRITICGNWEANGPDSLWAGSGTVDKYGNIECGADCGDDAYDLMEEQIGDGQTSGDVTVDRGCRKVTYSWNIE